MAGPFKYIGDTPRVIKVTGADLIAPLVAQAQAAAAIASTIGNSESRLSIYIVANQEKARAFGAYGVELDFAAGYYRKGHQIEASPDVLAGWSFNRDSEGTAQDGTTVETFAADIPRITPGVGLLMEPTTQNMLLRSREFDHSIWDKIATGTGITPVVVANDAVAPDGTTTADKITLSLGGGTAAGDRSHIQQDVVVTAGSTHGGSLFVKGVAGEKILFRHAGGGAYTVHTFNGAWQRIATVETATENFGFFEFGLRGAHGASNAVTFHAWGAQFEAGNDVTSYVATGEFSGTRDEDTAILSGLTLETCTVLIEATLTTGAATSELGRRALAVLYASSPGANNVTIINNDAGGLGAVVTAAGAVSGASTTPAVAAKDALQRVALRIATDDTQMVRNGVAGNWLFDGAVPSSLTALHIGGSPLSTLARLGGIIRKIVVFPFALDDSDLAVLTGGVAHPVSDIDWQRVTKAAAFSPRDSAKTFKLGGQQYLANGFKADGDNLRHDIWRSSNGVDYELVNSSPTYDNFSQMAALDGVIYAWRQKMFKSTDGGLTFTQILASLPWGISGFDNPAIVHDGKLLFVHGTGGAPTGTDGVWQFDPVDEEWSLLAAAPWGAREVPVVAEFEGHLYLFGGTRNVANVPPETTYSGKTTLNDMWRSTDGGETWAQIVADMPLAPRIWPAFTAFEGRLYLMGGYDNIGPANVNYSDTWVSDDGVNWTRLYAARDYLQRHAPVAYVFNGELFLASGNANAAAPGIVLNDIWRLVL